MCVGKLIWRRRRPVGPFERSLAKETGYTRVVVGADCSTVNSPLKAKRSQRTQYCTYYLYLLLPCPSRDARNMARDVQATLLKVLEEHGHMDTQAASEYVKKLQKRGRYLQDVWS